MKKFFIALSVLAALMLTVVPSQALIGMPDDTPGCDAVVPFICDISGTTGLNTLIVFADVGLGANVLVPFHYTIYTTKSATVFDDDLPVTVGDIVSTDAFTEVAKMAPAIRQQLEVDLDGDTVMDHYAGYIYYDNANLVNSIVGQFFFVDLANGVAAASNIPMKEYDNPLAVGAVPAAFRAAMLDSTVLNNDIELFSPNALMGAKGLQSGLAAPVAATAFGIYPRFFLLDSGDANWLIFWKSANVIPGILHVDYYDNAEVNVSSNVPLVDELTIMDVEPYLPVGLFPATTYPKEGWIQIEWSTIGLTPAATAALRNLEMLGWTYLQATSNTGDLNWSVLTPMWRDVR